jgi:AcrR family transcriptional regulator
MEERPSASTLTDVRAGATDTGRVNQKLRTRQALVDAAAELLHERSEDVAPSLAEIAARARVSKTTAYRYFASAEAVTLEVQFDELWPAASDLLAEDEVDIVARALAVARGVTDTLLEHETAMRVLVRNALDLSLRADADEADNRPGRRMALIDAALEPVVDELEPPQIRILRNALALTIGTEAVLAARDVCGLDAEETRELTSWATSALIEHALAGG